MCSEENGRSVGGLARAVTVVAVRVAVLVAATAAAGCATSAPVTVRRDRFNFNEAGAESAKEQILLNIVRLRYGEPMYFVDIGSMLSHYSIGASGEFSQYKSQLHVWNNPALRAVYNMRGEPVPGSYTWNANLNYTDSPTISYTPLTGEEFANRVMSPIPPSTILFLSQSGWGIDRLLACCVQRINDLTNTPIREAEQVKPAGSERFERLAALLRKAQDAGDLRFGVEGGAEGSATYLYLPKTAPSMEPEQREVRDLLDLPSESPLRVPMTQSAVRVEPNGIAIQTRSLLAVMHSLAQQVPVPSRHLRGDVVTTRPSTEDSMSSPTWLHVKYSLVPQIGAFAQVSYQGYWFYIDQTDWSSKRTFTLLTYLFSLQSTAKGQTGPLVTVPAGN